MGGKVGLERISGWIRKARLNDHLHIPKSEIKSNNTRKKWKSNPAKEESRSENQGVTGNMSAKMSTCTRKMLSVIVFVYHY